MLKTSVVIPTRNNAGTIRPCLESLIPYMSRGFIADVVVVDARSSDGTADIIKGYPVTLLQDEGKGVAIAYDLGWRASRGDIIMFMDGDAYLDEGYFPALLQFFGDSRVGVVGCGARAVVTGRLSRTVGEQWSWFRPGMNNRSSVLKRLYERLVFGGKDFTPGGPCLVARREALLAVDGFTRTDVPCAADMQLSRKIINAGFRAGWWPEAPLHHYPRATLRGLMKEYQGLAREEIERERMEGLDKNGYWRTRLAKVTSRLLSPPIGLMLAARFRNPHHLVVYPAIRYAWVAGYLSAWSKRTRKNAAAAVK
jgi:cellulose synthase/poly-beta-1,6-N-acetylglucosamine synthase-like glycosyltransferase